MSSWSASVRSPMRLRTDLADYARQRHMNELEWLVRALSEWDAPRAKKVSECSTYHRVRIPLLKPGNAKSHPCHCDQQLCPVCHSHRVRMTRARLSYILRQADLESSTPPLFVTLTFPRLGMGAKESYQLASKALTKFRRLRAFRKRWHGAMFAYESPWSERGWGPHWHGIVVGKYWLSDCRPCKEHGITSCKKCRRWSKQLAGKGLPAHHVWDRPRCDPKDPCLACAWSSSGGGRVVDIRRVSDSEAAVAELTKYVTGYKRGESGEKRLTKMPIPRIREWYRDMARIRRFRWYGRWQGVQVPKEWSIYVDMAPRELYRLATSGYPSEFLASGHAVDLARLITLPGVKRDDVPRAFLDLKDAADEHAATWVTENNGAMSWAMVVLSPSWAREAYAALDKSCPRGPPTVMGASSTIVTPF